MKKHLSATLFLLVLPWATGSAVPLTSPVTVLYHEPLVLLSDQAARVQDDAGRTVSFDAFGRRFELQLDKHRKLNRQRTNSSYELFKGKLTGIPGSWVRLMRQGDEISGMIADGEHVYVVEPLKAIAESLLEKPDNTTVTNVIYRMADTLVETGAIACGMAGENKPMTGQMAMESLVMELNVAPKLAALGAGEQVTIGVLADFQFFNTFGAGSEAEILSRFNVVDGIYTEQLGIEIAVADTAVFSSAAADPFSATTVPAELLDELSDYRRDAQNNHRQYGLSHLITARNLDGETVGIAFLGGLNVGGLLRFGVCTATTAASLSQNRGFGAMTHALIIAHEIGHNFGAPHDGESGSACESTSTGFLMAGEIGSSSPNRDRFSLCSLNQMQPVIDAADCLTPTDHVDLSVGPAGGLFPGNQAPIGENFDVVFEIENLGNSTANNVNVQVSMPPELTLVSLTLTGATCVPTAGSCDAGNVSGGSLRTLTLTLRGEIEGNFAVDVDVTADNDEDNTNNLRRTNIWMRRFVDLLAQFNTESSAAGVGERQQRTLTTINQGTHTAQNVDIRFTRGPDVVLEMGESESADCVTVNGVVTCTVDSLAPQDSVTVTIFFSASSAGTTQVNARATSDNPDLTPADNNDQVTITASSQVNAQNSGGGGGGSLTWLSLLMLLSVAAVRASDPARVVNPRNSIYTRATDSSAGK